MQLFIDTETTGFARNGVQPRIVSIAWIMADNPETAAIRKYLVVRPEGFTIPAPAAAVHGITTAKAMKAGKPLGQVLGDLATDIGQFAPRHLVAHNAAYDLPVIAAEYARLDRRNPCSALATACTMRMARETWPGESAKLVDVYRRLFGAEFAGAHNASADTLACAKIYFGMTRPAASRGQPGAGGQAMSPSGTERPARSPAEPLPSADWPGIVAAVLDWASRKPTFDTGFVTSLSDRIELGRELTEAQKAALTRIIRSWHIPLPELQER